ncbi:MAG: hypothetical protein Q8L21_03250, partial [Candidatus Komeilibacteria bacterium]|nr:hypothetical protein [Candidatus Komeilibacteria bacterium]
FAKQSLFYKKILTPDEAVVKVMAVKAKDIQQLANRIMDTKYLHIATLAPFKDIKGFARFIDI